MNRRGTQLIGAAIRRSPPAAFIRLVQGQGPRQAALVVKWMMVDWTWRARQLVPERLFDMRFDVDTRGVVRDLPESTPAPAGHGYQGVSPAVFRRIMRTVPLPPEGATFIDLGSGKGRAVFLAMQYPFSRVLGVERARDLHEDAERNLRRYRGPRRAGSVALVAGDATAFGFPPEPSVLFMYNPFGPAAMAAVVERMDRSLRDSPRPFVVIYLNPVHPEILESASELTMVEAPRIPGGGCMLAVSSTLR